MPKWKKRYKYIRKDFKYKLSWLMSPALAMAIVQTYAAYRHRWHIATIWAYLGFNHPKAYEGYCDKLMGKHLSGKDELYHTLYFACRELRDEFYNKLPERVAMGDALSVAYRYLKNGKE
jgi:hypothetical protein